MILIRWPCSQCGPQVLIWVDRDGNSTCMVCGGLVADPDLGLPTDSEPLVIHQDLVAVGVGG